MFNLFKSKIETKSEPINNTPIAETDRLIIPHYGISRADGSNRYEYTFKTKEEYLVWKKRWKSTYNEISLELHNLKKQRNDYYRKGEIGKGGSCASSIMTLKNKATDLLIVLKDGKKLSWKMKQEELERTRKD